MSTGSAQDTDSSATASPGRPAYQIPDVEKVHVAHPSLLALPSGRLVLAVEHLGPGIRRLPGAKGRFPDSNHFTQGVVLASGDGGETWSRCIEYPFANGCLFRDGANIYLAGQAGRVQIMRSADGGDSWSKPTTISAGDAATTFAFSPASVLVEDGRVWMPLLRKTEPTHNRVRPATLAPAMLCAQAGADLTKRSNWTLSEAAPPFTELVRHGAANDWGTPFFDVPDEHKPLDIGNRRWAERAGAKWPHVCRLPKQPHYWLSDAERAVHWLASADAHRASVAALARCRSGESPRVEFQPTPGGGRQLWLPLPGGHMRFDLQWDGDSERFWLVSQLARDSMRPAEALDRSHLGLPGQERRTLQLHFSSNLVDWCSAGLVAEGEGPTDWHTEPSLAFRGQDLLVACCRRSQPDSQSLYADSVSLHVVPQFRQLVY